jgi:predicted NodU family carbamoyl transferase
MDLSRLKVLGIHLGHHTAFSIINDGKVESVFEAERFYRQKGYKHHSLTLKPKKVKSGYQYTHIDELRGSLCFCLSQWGLNYDYIAVECQGRKEEFNNLEKLLDELGVKYKDIELINHHLSHACGAYFTSNFKRALILSYDGYGNDGATILFKAEGNKVSYLKKFDFSLGRAYNNAGYILSVNPEITGQTSGKIMGLSSYGNVRADWVSIIKEHIIKYEKRNSRPVKGLNIFGKGHQINSDFLENIKELKSYVSHSPFWILREPLKLKITTKIWSFISKFKKWMHRPIQGLIALSNGRQKNPSSFESKLPQVYVSHSPFWSILKLFGFEKIKNLKPELIKIRKRILKFDSVKNKIAQDFMKTFQYAWTELVLDLIEPYKDKFEKICITGGCALNGITNFEIIRKWGTKNVHLVPNPSDCGLSTGAALKVYWERTTNSFQGYQAYFNPYVGMDLFDKDKLEQFKEKNPHRVIHQERYIPLIAKLIYEGKIVGVIDGKCEIGPRALGNRSILCNPLIKNIREILNFKVKHREWFRPFAPVCTYEDAKRFFDLDGEIPYMSVICYTREEFRDKLPSITHVDRSARPQTVTRDQNPFLYDIIKEFEKLSGYPVLLNTSLNPRGEPILNYLQVAIDMIYSTDLDFIAYKNTLFGKSENIKKVDALL